MGGAPVGAPLSNVARLSDEVERFAYWVEDQWRRSEEERRRLTVVLSGMTEGVLLLDRYGRVLLSNDVAESLWPSLHPRLRGRNQIELFQDAELDRALTRALFQGAPQEVEVTRPGAGPGSPRRYWRVGIRPLSAERSPTVQVQGPPNDGTPAGAVMVIEDVTDRRDVERIRRDFVANVSHELQTPLTSIRGYAETLKDLDLEAAERERFLGRILEQTERMTALVHDLLSLAALEGPRMAPSEPIDAAELAADVVAEYRPEAELAAVALALRIADEVRGTPVSGRPGELRLAIGRPTDTQPVPPDRWLFLRVRDTGVGIPADALPRIFERFYRVDPARNRKTGGTGLGLAIVKHAVVGHGGHVDVDSSVGRGSVFTVWLPLAVLPPTGRN